MASTPTHLLNQTVTVQRKTNAKDDGGSNVETWADHLTGVKMAIQPGGDPDAERYGAERTRRGYTLYFAPGQDIGDDDRVVWSDTTTGSAVTRYIRIHIPPQDMAGRGVLVRAGGQETEGTP